MLGRLAGLKAKLVVAGAVVSVGGLFFSSLVGVVLAMSMGSSNSNNTEEIKNDLPSVNVITDSCTNGNGPTVNGWTVVKTFNVDPGRRWDGHSTSDFSDQWVDGVQGCYKINHKYTAYGNGGHWTTSEETWQSWLNEGGYLDEVYDQIDGTNGYDLFGGQEAGPLGMCFITCWHNGDPTETATEGALSNDCGHDCVAIHYKYDDHPCNCYCPTACTGVALENLKWIIENVPIGSIYYEYTSTDSHGWETELGLHGGCLYSDGQASVIFNSKYPRGTRDDDLTIADTPSWVNDTSYLRTMASYATSLGVTHETNYMIITDYELARMIILKKTGKSTAVKKSTPLLENAIVNSNLNTTNTNTNTAKRSNTSTTNDKGGSNANVNASNSNTNKSNVNNNNNSTGDVQVITPLSVYKEDCGCDADTEEYVESSGGTDDADAMIQQNAEIVWGVAKLLGCSDELAAGIVGNMCGEGGCSPWSMESDYLECPDERWQIGEVKKGWIADIGSWTTGYVFVKNPSIAYNSGYQSNKYGWAGGVGLFGFTGSNYDNLEDYAKSLGREWYDDDAFETQMAFSIAVYRKGYLSDEYKTKEVSSPEDAATVFCHEFEGISYVADGKLTAAREWYDKLKGTSGNATEAQKILDLAQTEASASGGSSSSSSSDSGECVSKDDSSTTTGPATDAQKAVAQVAINAANGTDLSGLTTTANCCLAFINDVFDKAGYPATRYPCAHEAMDASEPLSSDFSNVPIGACVFSSNASDGVSCGDHSAGHIAVYVGDGQVVENVGGIRMQSLDDWVSTWKNISGEDGVKWGWLDGNDLSKK